MKNHSQHFALEEIPVPMVYAAHRIIRDCNSAFAALFGFEKEELYNQSFSRLYPKIDDFVRTGTMWQSHMGGQQVYYDERIMVGEGGHRFWCKVHGRSRQIKDPFAEALYCFEPLNRPVGKASMTLTARQIQILTLVSQGKTNAAIAEEIGLSQRTVEAHRLRISQAIGVRNSAELMAWFHSH